MKKTICFVLALFMSLSVFIPCLYAEGDTSVSTENELREAINNGVTSIAVADSLTITQDLVIPGDVTIEVYSGEGEFIVEEGVTVTINGALYVHRLVVNGTLIRNGEGGCDIVVGTGTVDDGDEYFVNSSEVNSAEGFINALIEEQPNGVQNYIYVVSDLALSEDTVIPERTEIMLQNNTLEVPAGFTLTNYGYIGSDRGQLRVNGTLINEGYVQGYVVGSGIVTGNHVEQRAGVFSEQELREAIENGETVIMVPCNLSITQDLEIPEGTAVNVRGAGGFYTLTIEAGATVTNNGSLDASKLIINGTLIQNSDVPDIPTVIGTGVVINNSGQPWKLYCEVYSSEGFIEIAGKEYPKGIICEFYIVDEESITLQEDLVIQANTVIELEGFIVEIPEGITLTNRGKIITHGWLEVNGTLVNEGTIEGYLAPGTGTVIGNHAAQKTIVLSEQELREAIESGAIAISATNALSITQDLLIPEETMVSVNSLSIEEGITVTNNGTLNVNQLTVNGTLIQNGEGYGDSVTGTGTIVNNSGSRYEYVCEVYSSEEFTSAICGEYVEGIVIYIRARCDYVLPEDLTIPGNMVIVLNYRGDCTFEVPSGLTLTNRGRIESGIGNLRVNGTLINEGTVNGFVSGSGVLTGNHVERRTPVYSEQDLRNAIANGDVSITAYECLLVTQDLMIPEGVKVDVLYEGGELAIQNGVTVTNNGTLNAVQLTVNGTLIQNGDGSSDIVAGTGTIINNSGHVYENTCTVYSEEDLLSALSGAYPEGAINHIHVYCVCSLMEDLIIPQNTVLELHDQAFEVPAGITLTNHGTIKSYSGELTVNGSLVNEGTVEGYVRGSGSVTGNPVEQEESGIVSEQALREAIENGETEITAADSLTITQDLVIPEGVMIDVYSGDGVFTIETGVTVTNNGTLNVNQLVVNGTLIQNGTGGCGSVSGTGTILNNTEPVYQNCIGVYSADEFADAFEGEQPAGARKIIIVYFDHVLSEDMTVPADTVIELQCQSFEIPEGYALVNYGTIISLDGQLRVNGTLVNDGIVEGFVQGTGTVSGTNPVENRAYVRSEQELRDALDNGAQNITIAGTLTITQALVIPEAVIISGNGNYCTLIIEPGAVVTNRGSLSANEIVLNGTFEQYGSGWCDKLSGNGVFHSYNWNSYYCFENVDSEEELIEVLASEFPSGAQKGVGIDCDITLSTDLEIPEFVQLYIYSERLEVPAGRTLTNYGMISSDNGKLVVNGTLVNEGTINGFVQGNGIIQGTQNTSVGAVVHTDQEFRDAIARGVTEIRYDPGIIITSDVEIPEGVSVSCYDSGESFAIGENATLTNRGYFRVLELTLNGCLVNYGDADVNYFVGTGSARNYGSGSFVSYRYAETEDEMRMWLDSDPVEGTMNRIQIGDIILTGDLVVPDGTILDITGHTLLVPEGITLVNYGIIRTPYGEMTVNGALRNENTIEGYFRGSGTLAGTQDVMRNAQVFSEQALREAIDAGATYIEVYGDGAVAITEDLEIPEGVTVRSYHEMTIASGVTVVNRGELKCKELVLNGTIVNHGYGVSRDIRGTGSIQNHGENEFYQELSAYSEEELRTCLANQIPTGAYNRIDVYVYSDTGEYTDIILSGNLVIPDNAIVSPVRVVVPEGVTLTNYGVICTEGELIVEGTFVNEGSVTGFGNRPGWVVDNGQIIGSSETLTGLRIYNEQELRNAIDAGLTFVDVYATITITENLDIPEGVIVQGQYSWSEPYFIVSPGVTVNNHGSLNMSTVIVNGILNNYGVGNSSFARGTGRIVDCGGVNGFVNWLPSVHNQDTLLESLQESVLEGIHGRYISVNDIIIYGDVEIPDDVSLTVYNSMTILPEASLVNRGIILGEKMMEYGNVARIYAKGTFTNEGTVRDIRIIGPLDSPEEPVEVTTEEELREAVALGNHAIVIPEDAQIMLQQEHELAIPEGCVLTINGTLVSSFGELRVNGTLINEGTVEGYVQGNGELTGSQETVRGAAVTSEEELRAAIDAGITFIDVFGDITITEDLDIPANTLVEPLRRSWGEPHFTISEGVTVNNYGTLHMATLIVDGVLNNYGSGSSSFVQGNGRIVNSGTGIFQNNVFPQTEQEFRDALNGTGPEGVTKLFINLLYDFTLTSDAVIPDDIEVCMQSVTLTIPDDVTLINNGTIRMQGNEHYASVICVSGALVNNGTIRGNEEYPAGTIISVNGVFRDDGLTEDVLITSESVRTVTFFAGAENVEGTMEPVTVITGSSYVLPECGYMIPKGKTFTEWLVTTDGSAEPVSMQPGDVIIISGNVTLTAAWEDAPAFMSHTLLLTGQIGVNFYMDMSVLTQEEREAAVMHFTVSGRTVTDTFDESSTNPSSHQYYGFTCFINSIQMADEITAELHYVRNGKERTVSQTYSAQQYIQFVLSHESQYSHNAVTLVKAIADYGHYVQPFLAANNSWTLGAEHVVMDTVNEFTDADVDIAKTAVADMAIVKDLGDSQIEKVTYSLDLETETAIRIYIKVKEGYTESVTATVDGNPIDCVMQNDGRYRIEIAGISAHRLGDTYHVTVNADGVCTVTVSALSYVYSVLYSDQAVFNNDDAHYAVASLYRYYTAIMAYRANPDD